MSKRLSFDTRWDRDSEREPTWRGPVRPVIPLSYQGAVRQHITGASISRCTTCSKPTAGVRCRECQEQDARECACGCYTVAGDLECTACGQGRAA